MQSYNVGEWLKLNLRRKFYEKDHDAYTKPTSVISFEQGADEITVVNFKDGQVHCDHFPAIYTLNSKDSRIVEVGFVDGVPTYLKTEGSGEKLNVENFLTSPHYNYAIKDHVITQRTWGGNIVGNSIDLPIKSLFGVKDISRRREIVRTYHEEIQKYNNMIEGLPVARNSASQKFDKMWFDSE